MIITSKPLFVLEGEFLQFFLSYSQFPIAGEISSCITELAEQNYLVLNKNEQSTL